MKPYALILGASSEIARSTAQNFADNGFNLYLAGRDSEFLERDAQDLSIRYEIDIKTFNFDLTETDPQSFLKLLNPQPDVVIFAVGQLGKQEYDQFKPERIKQILDVNFTSAVRFLEPFAEMFESRKSGSMIIIGSVAGNRGRASNYLYGSAKAGLEAWASGLRNRLSKSGVHVLTVKPGFVATRMTEGLDLPKALTATPDQAGKSIFKAWKKKRNIIYVRWYWRWIMTIIGIIPERIFKKLSI